MHHITTTELPTVDLLSLDRVTGGKAKPKAQPSPQELLVAGIDGMVGQKLGSAFQALASSFGAPAAGGKQTAPKKK